jgi:hypothetical protein
VVVVASPDAWVMMEPFAAYRALRRDEPTSWLAAGWGVLRWLLFVACFVSWTTSGRLLVEHLLFGPIAWAFAPLLQALWIVVSLRIAARQAAPPNTAPAPKTPQLIALYFRGHAPWMVLLFVVSGICLFVPEPSRLLVSGLGIPLVGALFVAALVWGGVITFALFRAGCGLSRGRSAFGTALFYAGYAGSLTTHYAVTGQLAPILGWVS